MTYKEAIQFLLGLRVFGTHFGLEAPRRLAARAGDPHRQLRFIHVAGTNGKGSVCAMLESVYRAQGLRVGLFTSPHLVAFGERIQVNRQPIREADLARLVADMQAWLREFPQEHHPTFFEVVTVLALRYFAEQQCELVIWETGLGGRLDATNIVTPLASVITNVQFDHEQWLGDTLARIAAEKAGIIKPGVPVLTAAEAPEALAVIAETARRLEAPLTVVTKTAAEEGMLRGLPLPLAGEHQRHNAALALATVAACAAQIPVSPAAMRQGLNQLQWPGRLQYFKTPEGTTLLLDGAHNPAGAEVLRQEILRHAPNQPTLILGVLQDKNWMAICRTLAPVARRLLLVPVPSERTARPEDLAPVCSQANPAAALQTCATLAEALKLAAPDPWVVITGSLYLIGQAMEQLGLADAGAPGERALNEWGAKPVQQAP